MMTFEEIQKFEAGQVFYENGYGLSIRFVLTTKPVLKEAGDQLHFIGDGGHGEADFMMHKDYPHYGPKISLEPEYAATV